MNHSILKSIAEKHKCPVYVYDGNKIKKQYERLTNAFSGIKKLRINYACKALSNISILNLMRSMGSGLDTVSIQEVQLGLKAGFKAENIIFTPNGVSMNEIEKVASLGVQINIDNLTILEQFGTKYQDVPVCIRINPHVMAGGNSNISVGHIDSKFGISIHQTPHLLRIIKNTNIKVNGIHMHTGSDILDTSVFLQASEILFDLASKLDYLEFIDFGSGLKVPYYQGDSETNIEELGDKLSERFNEFCSVYGRDLKLIFEPGKYIIADAGYLLTKVVATKKSYKNYIGTDAGMETLMRNALYGAYHKIFKLGKESNDKEVYDFTGQICENTDRIATDRLFSNVKEGDLLAVMDTGAYGYSMSHNFNTRPRAAEVLVSNEDFTLIRKRETLENIFSNCNV